MSLCHLHTFLANRHFADIIQNMILLHGNKMCNQVISVKAYFNHCWLIITSTDFGSVGSTLQQFNSTTVQLKATYPYSKGFTTSILGSIIWEPFLAIGSFAQNGQFNALNISALNVKVVGIIAFIALPFSVGPSNNCGFGFRNESMCEDVLCCRICCCCGRILTGFAGLVVIFCVNLCLNSFRTGGLCHWRICSSKDEGWKSWSFVLFYVINGVLFAMINKICVDFNAIWSQ